MYQINGKFLNEKISEKGLKKQHIASEIGMTPQTFSKKVGGKTDWTLTEVGKLIAILGCELEELFRE